MSLLLKVLSLLVFVGYCFMPAGTPEVYDDVLVTADPACHATLAQRWKHWLFALTAFALMLVHRGLESLLGFVIAECVDLWVQFGLLGMSVILPLRVEISWMWVAFPLSGLSLDLSNFFFACFALRLAYVLFGVIANSVLAIMFEMAHLGAAGVRIVAGVQPGDNKERVRARFALRREVQSRVAAQTRMLALGTV